MLRHVRNGEDWKSCCRHFITCQLLYIWRYKDSIPYLSAMKVVGVGTSLKRFRISIGHRWNTCKLSCHGQNCPPYKVFFCCTKGSCKLCISTEPVQPTTRSKLIPFLIVVMTGIIFRPRTNAARCWKHGFGTTSAPRSSQPHQGSFFWPHLRCEGAKYRNVWNKARKDFRCEWTGWQLGRAKTFGGVQIGKLSGDSKRQAKFCKVWVFVLPIMLPTIYEAWLFWVL